ncbi:dihydroneopterin aldolase, partial [Acinetobacter baumannii]
DLIERVLAEGHIQLVETVAKRVVEALGAFPMVRYAEVRVTKPSALSKARAAGAIWAATFSVPDVQG